MKDGSTTEISKATYRARCEHGFAAESETSKTSLHDHYDSTNELLVSFLDLLYDR
ncbi:hypothetical protein [Natrinema amylolyticum]|uniref:hypothetical protein n=1 Tax=Natrinema amylolyticum TaxID=2878679 RepID=UPI001CFC3EEA|nr:hypothetical protein [Natrinema amylolyticum]